MNERKNVWTGVYWRAVAERALWTAAQVGALYLGADVIDGGIDVRAVDWPSFASWAAGGAILSVVKSVAANAATGTGPSTGRSETVGG